MGKLAVRLCASDCGGIVQGRSHKRFCSPACRVRAHRRVDPTADSKGAPVPEKALQRGRAVHQHVQAEGVTLPDRGRAVRCSGCGAAQPKLEGPLPVAFYCRNCVTAGAGA